MNETEVLKAKLAEVKSFNFTPLKENLLYAQLASSTEAAEDLVEAFLQFFCIHAVVAEHEVLANPAGIIDEVYHLFILNDTQAYLDFCVQFFGREIHHSHKTACQELPSHGDDPEIRVRELLRLYGEDLHPLLRNWMAHGEKLEALTQAERRHIEIIWRIHALRMQAQACLDEVSALIGKI